MAIVCVRMLRLYSTPLHDIKTHAYSKTKNLSLTWRLKWNGFDSLEHGIKTRVPLAHTCVQYTNTPPRKAVRTLLPIFYIVWRSAAQLE